MVNKKLSVEQSIRISALPCEVWHTLTNPKRVAFCFMNTQLVTDWQKGSKIFFQGEWNGVKYRDGGVILHYAPEKSLRYSYWSGFSGLPDQPENYSLVEYKLSYANKKTTLRVKQTGFASEQNRKHSVAGWKHTLKQMKEITEKEYK